MKIKKLISALVLGSMLVGLSGCNITDFSAENLLRPPKAVGDEAEIEQLIAKTADSGYTLKYPKNGKFRSAIIMTDLDGNDSNEAVAFFRNSAETSSVHMLVMYSKDNSWEIASDNIFETTDIDSVDWTFCRCAPHGWPPWPPVPRRADLSTGLWKIPPAFPRLAASKLRFFNAN